VKHAHAYSDHGAARSAAATAEDSAHESTGSIAELFLDADCRNAPSGDDADIDLPSARASSSSAHRRAPRQRSAEHAGDSVLSDGSPYFGDQCFEFFCGDFSLNDTLELESNRRAEPW
jgi:hypothetical protein